MKKNTILKLIALVLCATLFTACFSCKDKEKEENVNQRYTVVEGEFLYSDGLSEYSILIRDDANYYEEYAAQELASILKKATGHGIPIVKESKLNNKERVISLGHTALWDENVKETLSSKDIIDSGYYVKTVEKNVYISCPDNTSSSGVLYGVYDFLKDVVDYEFYAATEVYYKQTKNIPLLSYKGITVNPSFEMRLIRNADLRDDSDTVRRYRMIYSSPAFGLITYGHGQASQYVDPDAPCTCGKEGCGNGITYQQHHSDWYSGYGSTDLQLCWTGGELLEEVVANRFIDYFKQYPDGEYFMFGQEDNVSYCKCERCVEAMNEYAYNPAGLQVAFMNNVIKRTNDWLEKNEPGRKVKYIIYAYYGCEAAPVVTDANGNVKEYSEKVVPVDDLYIFYTPIYTNFAFQFDSKENSQFFKNLKDWSVIADGQLIMYLYDINFRNYFINFNNFGTVKGMYETCKDLGVACMTTQAADSYTACFQEMRSYVESSLMWDLNQSYDDLVRKFMKAYYKDAADYIYAYYEIIRDRYAYYQNAVDVSSGGIYGAINGSVLWTQPVIEKIDAEFEKALQSIEKYKTSDPATYEKLKTRIKKESLTPTYIKLTTLKAFYSSQEYAQMKEEFKYYATLFKFAESEEGSPLAGFLE